MQLPEAAPAMREVSTSVEDQTCVSDTCTPGNIAATSSGAMNGTDIRQPFDGPLAAAGDAAAVTAGGCGQAAVAQQEYLPSGIADHRSCLSLLLLQGIQAKVGVTGT